MVGPRYASVSCRRGLGIVQVYIGGCVIDVFDEREPTFFGDDCNCNLGKCQAVIDDGLDDSSDAN